MDLKNGGGENNHKKSVIVPVLIAIIMTAIIIVGGGVYFFSKYSVIARDGGGASISVPGGNVGVCPQDMKICPDGSGVGRVGVDCVFEECSGVSNESGSEGNVEGNTIYGTYNNVEYGFSFRYPSDWVIDEYDGSNPYEPFVGLTSPETRAYFENSNVPNRHDISIHRYRSVADDPENKGNRLGAKTIEELANRNLVITKIGALDIDNANAMDVIWGGMGAHYVLLIEHSGYFYQVWFDNIDSKNKLTDVNKEIISSLTFEKK